MNSIKNNYITSLKDNLTAKFGEVNRSSAIFWIAEGKVRSVFSVSNYWKYKNNMSPHIYATWRTKDGLVKDKELLNFENRDVINICNQDKALVGGSVEIEAISDKDLRIPYAAVMAIYESINNISMVHSYSRILNNNELISTNTVNGSEGCWVLKDNAYITSFAVFHNGPHKIDKFKAKIIIKNINEEEKYIDFTLDELKPYQTVYIIPKDLFNGLNEFLGGQYGSANINYKLGGAFTRMLIGWFSNEGQLTVTHSNFNYSEHPTDYLDSETEKAYVVVPKTKEISNTNKIDQLVVYDGRANSTNIFYKSSDNYELIKESQKIINCNDNDIIFESNKGPLPSRIVNGLVKQPVKSNVGFECSLGVINHIYNVKRFHWCLASFLYNSSIIATAYTELFGKIKDEEKLVFKLYSTTSIQSPVKTFKWHEISDEIQNGGIKIEKLFSEEIEKTEFNKYFYISVFSEYGGFCFFTDLLKNNNRTLEHSF